MSKILFIPDICVQKKVELSIGMLNFIQNEVDFSVGNLEGFIREDKKENEMSSIKDEFFDIANKIKLKYVSVANNHFLDGGYENSQRTIRYLHENNIKAFGTTNEPFVSFNLDNKKISILGSVWTLTGTRSKDLNKFFLSTKDQERIIGKLADNNSIIIWFTHWGTDMEKLPSPWQVDVANKILTAGANIIYGHHPHLIQPIAKKASKTVIFSGGNFIMPFNEITYYYTQEAFKSLIALLDTKSEQIELYFAEYEPSTGKLFLKNSNKKKKPFVRELSYFQTKTYEKYFKKNRAKKRVPIIKKNVVTNIPKVIFIKAVIFAFSLSFVKKIWRLLKRGGKAKKNKIVIIGGFLKGEKNFGGETIKNEILAKYLNKYASVIRFNTYDWRKKRCSISIRLLFLLFKNSSSPIILSAADNGAITFIKNVKKIGLHRYLNVHYLVIGGNIHNRVKNDEKLLSCLKDCKKIYVETLSLMKKLEVTGLTNVVFLPNFKDYSFSPRNKPINDKTELVFFSRVCKEKGVELAIDAVKQLSKKYAVKLDIYGPIDDSYKKKLELLIKDTPNIRYNGVLKPDTNETYEILSQYDLMLFPTFHKGEGFPGAIIDSYISGVPVLATNWKYNSEIVEEGKTGWLVEPNNEKALEEKLIEILYNKEKLNQMRKNCVEEAKKYHVDNVLPKLLKEMNIEV